MRYRQRRQKRSEVFEDSGLSPNDQEVRRGLCMGEDPR
jgi:hypothetical protein